MKIFVAQDPYQMGYRGVTLCIAAAKGETVADETAPAVWYNSET